MLGDSSAPLSSVSALQPDPDLARTHAVSCRMHDLSNPYCSHRPGCVTRLEVEVVFENGTVISFHADAEGVPGWVFDENSRESLGIAIIRIGGQS